MSDPVILPSGHTFDRSSIQHWLDPGHRTCPISNLPLPPHPNLIPNHGLRSLISSFFESSTSVASTSLVANRLVRNPPSSKFTWTIRNFSKLSVKKLYSELFLVGGCKWRILIYPKGNNVDHLSLYLDVAESAQLPHKRRSMHVQFSFGVVDEVKMVSIRKGTQHRFNARENDWGFTSFMPLNDLCDPNRGYVVNDTLVVEAEVAVQWVSHWTYDSKMRTGYVGLKNHGETGYMNTLLQTLYHIPYLRKASVLSDTDDLITIIDAQLVFVRCFGNWILCCQVVYLMYTTENDMPSGSIPLALQKLFYNLQYGNKSVTTKELTRSFGWNPDDSFMQHDAHGLFRILCEKLEDKMKGTFLEDEIQKLFEGHHMSYINCINVNYKSTRKESFYDLQLDV